jgi:hypothetical protein
MPRPLRLAIASLLTLLAATPAVHADPLYSCPTSAYTAYYVVWGRNSQPGPFVIETHNGTTGGAHDIDLLQMEYPILRIICSADENTWLSQHSLWVLPTPLANDPNGELFAVYDTSTWTVVGTAWRDLYAPFDQGGAMGYQKYWSRTAGYWAYNIFTRRWMWIAAIGPAIQNVTMFSSGLDRSAINGTSETDKDSYYFSHISSLLNAGLDSHMITTENYPYQYTKQDFLSTFGTNSNNYVHYDLIDPTGGAGGMNP